MVGTIEVCNVGKRYRVPQGEHARPLFALFRSGFRRSQPEYHWGLRNVSFSVAAGRTVGVVGSNGAGKSSLLRLIGGVGKPDEGTIEVRGHTSAVLDIGAGMTDDLTGSENLMLTGIIAGMTRAELRERRDRIVSFAELEEPIDHPVRTYSTGMKMRLAFSVAIHADPDIMLVDEVLAVGDASFQRKCLARILEIKNSGCTIFFVSHDPSLVRAICDDVLYLRKGEVVAFGPTEKVLSIYESAARGGALEHDGNIADLSLPDGTVLQAGKNRFGSHEAEIRNVRLINDSGGSAGPLLSGSGLTVEFEYHAQMLMSDLIASVKIRTSDGSTCYDTNTFLLGLKLRAVVPGKVTLRMDRLDLASGDYWIEVGLYDPDWNCYDAHVSVYPLTIFGNETSNTFFSPPARWRRNDAPGDVEVENLGAGDS